MTNEKNSISIIFGQNVRHYRKRIKLTQEKLGEKVDVSGKYISNIERGVSFPSASVIERLAGVLGVKFYFLFVPEETEGEGPLSNYVAKDAFKGEIYSKFRNFIEEL